MYSWNFYNIYQFCLKKTPTKTHKQKQKASIGKDTFLLSSLWKPVFSKIQQVLWKLWLSEIKPRSLWLYNFLVCQSFLILFWYYGCYAVPLRVWEIDAPLDYKKYLSKAVMCHGFKEASWEINYNLYKPLILYLSWFVNHFSRTK